MEGWTFDAMGNLIPAGSFNLGATAPVGAVPELPPNPQMLASAPPAMPQTPLAGALAAAKPQMSFDLNAPQNQWMPQQSTVESPNLAPEPAGPSIGDQVGNAAKKLGNLTPDQVKSIQAMTGMGQQQRLAAPAAAIPRGTTGQMQQHQMAAPRARMTLAQLIGMR